MSETTKPLVMGVLNVTPDSFSDGGRWLQPDQAFAHARALVDEGAAIIDVGGESTRPGSQRVDVATELDRVLPVVEHLVDEGIEVSVDTMNAETAVRVARLGARYVNDVSGGLADPDMLGAVADTDAIYICSHWRGLLADPDAAATYRDVTEEVLTELSARLDAARAAGIPDERLISDPGLGFSKRTDDNWQLLADIDRFVALGLPVLVGASRKRFISETVPQTLRTGPAADADRAQEARDAATAAVAALLFDHDIWAWRVHDAAATTAALNVAHELRRRGA